MPKLDAQIETLQERLKQLKDPQQAIENRKKAIAGKRERKADNPAEDLGWGPSSWPRLSKSDGRKLLRNGSTRRSVGPMIGRCLIS